jgi:hypothetical protein
MPDRYQSIARHTQRPAVEIRWRRWDAAFRAAQIVEQIERGDFHG